MKNRTLNKILVVLISMFGCVGVASAEAVDEFATGHWQNGYNWTNTSTGQAIDQTWVNVSGYRCLTESCDGTSGITGIGKAIDLSEFASHNSDSKWNTGLGTNSLNSLTTGSENTAIGFSALSSNTTGNENTAVGKNSLDANTSGISNTAIGTYSLKGNTSGIWNTANGAGALMTNTTGGHNTANGTGALFNNTTGYKNTASGSSALYNNTTGYHNTANGFETLTENTTGVNNVANGYKALTNNTTGYNNVAVGKDALENNTTGWDNIASGIGALNNNTTGTRNIASGTEALYFNTTGGDNVANGDSALTNNTTGDRNVAIGRDAGYNSSTGSRNVMIGYAAGYDETGSDKLYISNSGTASPLIYGDFSAGEIKINGDLKVDTLQDANGVNMIRKVGDVVHIGVNSVTIEDSTTTTSGKDEIGSTINDLQIGTGASHNTTIEGTLTVQTPTADGHATTKLYVDTLTSANAGNITSEAATARAAEQANAGNITTNASNIGTNTSSINTLTSRMKVDSAGRNNTSIGLNALNQTATGANNTSLGSKAGYSNTAGSRNIFLGYEAGYNETGSDKLYISNSSSSSPLIYGDFSSGQVEINGELKVGALQDSNGNNMVRKVGDTVHIGVNSVTFEDATTSSSGKDEIGSTIDELQIGTSASHNTSIVGTLSIQEATADNHAVTRSYVDTQTSGFTSSINSNTSNITINTNDINNLSTGLAQSMAMASLATPVRGRSSFSIGTGYYDGKSALAYGFAQQNKSGNGLIRIMGASAGGVNSGAASFSWGY